MKELIELCKAMEEVQKLGQEAVDTLGGYRFHIWVSSHMDSCFKHLSFGAQIHSLERCGFGSFSLSDYSTWKAKDNLSLIENFHSWEKEVLQPSFEAMLAQARKHKEEQDAAR